MSFIEQERAMFDLLFDAELRAEFIQHSTAALSHYKLSPSELEDFLAIRPDALAIDAQMRRSMVLAQLTRSYPISISLLSSIETGLSSAEAWIAPALMRAPPKQRPLLFGQAMAAWLKQYSFNNSKKEKLILSIQEAELSMAWTAANVGTTAVIQVLPEDWPQKPIRMAKYISAALLPLPYHELKQQLCPVSDALLWRQLNRQAIDPSLIEELLNSTEQHLLVALACIESGSVCDPQTHHRSVVLNEGFAALFQHVNGHNSVVEILMQLSQAGASNKIVHSVKAGFQQLLEQGMLKLV